MVKKSVTKYPISENKLAIWVVIGIILILILVFIFFMFNKEPAIKKLEENEDKISFVNENVHLKIGKDFSGNEVPVYDSIYCEKKYFEKYNKESSCIVDSVKTYSKLNPLVIEVKCTCDK